MNEWCHKIRKEGYQLDRQVRSIRNEEEKVKRSLKQAASKGDKDTCTILAKEIVRSRKATNRIYMTKAHLNSVQLQMKNQLATLRVAGSLSKSTEVMQAMQNLVRLPEIAGVMREMSKEMTKAGIIEEMLEETMDSFEDTEELEEEVQTEVDKVSTFLTLLFISLSSFDSVDTFDVNTHLVCCDLHFFRCFMKSPRVNLVFWNHRQLHQLSPPETGTNPAAVRWRRPRKLIQMKTWTKCKIA